MIINTIDQSLIRDLLDDARISTKKDDDGDLMTILTADDDFPHDVFLWFMVEDNWLTIIARAFDYKTADPMGVANEYNRTHRAVSCIAEDDTVFFKLAFLLDEEVSTTYITENCLKFAMGCCWRSFCDLVKNS